LCLFGLQVWGIVTLTEWSNYLGPQELIRHWQPWVAVVVVTLAFNYIPHVHRDKPFSG